MPRLWDEWLDTVVYLYPDALSARIGSAAGGSGFLIGVKSEMDGHRYTYAVTNAHVIEGGHTVVRINTQDDDDTQIFSLKADHWMKHPGGDDIAIAMIEPFPTDCRATVMPREICTGEGFDVAMMGLGPGDEVFMLGRFVTHDGVQTNQPVARFGNVAMKPTLILRERKKKFGGNVEVLSWLVESRSLSGMSGSPVFWYIPPNAEWQAKNPPQIGAPGMRQAVRGPFLLGIDWGHPAVYDKVVDSDKQARHGLQVQANSGFMCVAPSWKVAALLDSPEAVMERKARDEIRKQPKATVVQDVAESRPFSKPDMEDALKRVARKRSKPSRPDAASRRT